MKFYNIFFSPTGGTKKVADIIINGTRQEAEVIDLIKDPEKIKKLQLKKDDVCLVVIPSYGGRIPSVITDMFRNVKADGTKAILTVVFGNRAIDDTLLELQDVLEASGFVCIAGMEAVAEHSLMHQFGTGRPDSLDEKELMGFAAKIMENITTQKTPEFPGNQRIIAGNAQFAGIAAGRGVRFTTGLLLLGKGLGMRETPIRPHSWH